MKRLVAIVVTVGLLVSGTALVAGADHVNSPAATFHTSSVGSPAVHAVQGNHHCDRPGYGVAIRSRTYGFGFNDSTGTVTLSLKLANGSWYSQSWANTEMDKRYHLWVTNFGRVVEARWQYQHVWWLGDAYMTVYCSSLSPGRYNGSW